MALLVRGDGMNAERDDVKTAQDYPTLTPSGQPRVGSRFNAPLVNGGTAVFEVVGRLYGRKGIADCIGVVLEDVETGQRESYDWPLILVKDHPL